MDLQIRAFEWRGEDIKNKAGFLINAIERNYALPDNFLRQFETIEIEKERARQEALAEEQRKEANLQIAKCQLCDKKGHRNVKHHENGSYKVLHTCTHDSEIEAKFEDWQ